MRIRSTEVALAAAGVLVAHELGYGGAELLRLGFSDPGHAHLPALFGILVPLALLAAGLGVLRLARGQIGAVRPRSLLAIQIVLFLGLEFAEHAAAGAAISALTNPAVILGLLAQPLVARAIHRVLRGAAKALRSRGNDPIVQSVAPNRAMLAVATSGLALWDGSLLPRRRGPPR